VEVVKEAMRGKINFQLKRLTSRRPEAWNQSLIIVLIQTYQHYDYTKGHPSNSFLKRIREGGGMEGPPFIILRLRERLQTLLSLSFTHRMATNVHPKMDQRCILVRQSI